MPNRADWLYNQQGGLIASACRFLEFKKKKNYLQIKAHRKTTMFVEVSVLFKIKWEPVAQRYSDLSACQLDHFLFNNLPRGIKRSISCKVFCFFYTQTCRKSKIVIIFVINVCVSNEPHFPSMQLVC